MARKTWIKLKRGILEPKHRERIGPAVWLYIYILDRADWEQGAVLDWTDQAAADAMGMNARTVRYQRVQLEEQGYIQTTQKQHHLKLAIMNWVNPREYSGQVYNPGDTSKGDKYLPPSEIQGDSQGDIQGGSEIVTPTLNSHDSHINLNNKTEHQRFWERACESALDDAPKYIRDNAANMTPVSDEGDRMIVAVRDQKGPLFYGDRFTKKFERALLGIANRPISIEFVEGVK